MASSPVRTLSASRLRCAVEWDGSSAMAIIPCFRRIIERTVAPSRRGTDSWIVAHPGGMFHRPAAGSSTSPKARIRSGVWRCVLDVSLMPAQYGYDWRTVRNSAGAPSRHTAVDVDRGAADIGGVVGGQKSDDLGDLHRLADSSQGDSGNHRLFRRGWIRVAVDAVLHETGADVARRDRVDTNAVRAVVESQAACHPHQA